MPRHAKARPFATSDPELLSPGPTFAIGDSVIDPTQEGFTIVHNYALYFWRPYLGNTAFALWVLLVSFAFGDDGIAFPSISRLARMLTNSDHSRAVVTGRQAGRAARGYAGALATLRRERLVQTSTRGRGGTMRYVFRVLKQLPLLTPAQVARLSPHLQDDHAAWLDRCGILPEEYLAAYRDAPWNPDAGDALAPGEDIAAPTSVAPLPEAAAQRTTVARTPGEAVARTTAAATRATPVNPRSPDRAAHRTVATSPSRTGALPSRTGALPSRTGAATDAAPADSRSTNNTNQQHQIQSLWQETLEALRSQLTPTWFDYYLAHTHAIAVRNNLLYVQVADATHRDFVLNRMNYPVQMTLIAVSEGQLQGVDFIAPGEELPPEHGAHAGEPSCAH